VCDFSLMRKKIKVIPSHIKMSSGIGNVGATGAVGVSHVQNFYVVTLKLYSNAVPTTWCKACNLDVLRSNKGLSRVCF